MALHVGTEQTSGRKYGVKVYGLRYPLTVKDARQLALDLEYAADVAERETERLVLEREDAKAVTPTT